MRYAQIVTAMHTEYLIRVNGETKDGEKGSPQNL